MKVRSLFVNLPVADVARSRAFFTALGLRIDERFSNAQAVCVVLHDSTSVMLLVQDFFRTFTKLPLADAARQTEVLLALQVDTRDEVGGVVARAVAAGATTPNAPQDHGFMMQHGFADPDGHQWEVFWMDPAGMPDTAAADGANA